MRILIASTGKGTFHAAERPSGHWQVQPVLADREVRCLASDPLNRNVIYAGSQGDGVFRSDDHGRTWRSAGMSGQVVKSLAVSSRESGVVYAGTRPALVFRSADGGQNWTELPGFRRIRNRWWWFSPAEPPWQAYVQALAISPTDPKRILAGIEFGAVVLSEDGGQTWSPHRRGALRDCHSLAFHARDGSWAYEAGGTGGGASISRDGGRTWSKTTDGLARPYGVACAADPARPEVWYVSVAPGPSKAYGDPAEAYLYRASGGAAWHSIGWEPPPMRHMPRVLVTDPGRPGHVYAATTGGQVWHSNDHGESWTRLAFDLGSGIHAFAVLNPSPKGGDP